MAEPQIGAVVAPPMKPSTNGWERVKQGFLALYQAPVATSDDLLTAQIRQAFAANHLVRDDIAQMGVTANGAVVTLTGHVVGAINKKRAGAAASAVPGVAMVVNQLVVDDELMSTVAQALGDDQETENEQIQVSVQHGVVYLGGTVRWTPVRKAAAQVAARISQVRGIINLIHAPGIVIDSDEEAFVQPLIGSEIYAIDRRLGRVQQVLINPLNRRVGAVVINTDTTTLISIGRIRCARSGALFLNAKSGEATSGALFNPLNFTPPPANWQPPYPYRSADVLFDRHRS